MRERFRAHKSNTDKRFAKATVFNVKSQAEEIRSSAGEGIWAECPYMWEGAYGEWAKSAKGGFLSDAEIKANLTKLLSNPHHPKSHGIGPRGSVEIAIPNYVCISQEIEFSSTR